MRRVPRCALLGPIIVVLYAHVSAAAAPPPTERVAVVLLSKDAKDPAASAFAQALYKLGERAPELTLISENQLAKLLKGNPVKMFTKCGPKLPCVTKLGKRAKAQSVLFGKWQPADGKKPATLQYLLIATASTRIRAKGVLQVPTAADAPQVVANNFKAMFGVEPPPPLQSEAAATPTPPVATTPAATSELPPAGTPQPPADGQVVAPLQEAPPQSAGQPDATTQPPAVAQVAPVTGTSATALGPTADATLSTHKPPYLFISSLVLLGAGAVALGTGGALVLDAHHQADGVTTGPNGTPPAQAVSTVQSANDKIKIGNTLFGVGGGIAAVGAVLLVLDRFDVFGGNDSSGHVSVMGDVSNPTVGMVYSKAF